MKIWWLKCFSSWLILSFVAQPVWTQEDDFLGGPAVPETDVEAQDAQPEDFDEFNPDLFGNQRVEPTEEEIAEVTRLNTSGMNKLQQGDLDGALDDFEQSNLVVANFSSYLEIGRILREQGNAAAAITNLNRAVQLVRNVPPEQYSAAATEVLKELGLAYLDTQEFNNAIQAFQQAQLLPGQRRNAELIFNQGLAQSEFALNQQYSTSETRVEDLNAAIALYDRAIEINPEYAEALYERGNAYFILQQLDEAYDDLQKAVELEPANAESVAQLGFVSLRRGLSESQSRNGQRAQIVADLSAAVEHFTKFLELVPAKSAEEEKDPDEEVLEVNRESVLLSRSAAFIGLGEESGEDGDGYFRRAVADAEEALMIIPDLSDAHFQRGMAFRMLGDFDQSLDAFTSALELNPGSTEALLRRGIVYFREGDYQLARADFTKAIQYSTSAHPRAHLWLGLTYAKQNELKKAINEYSLALRYQPFFTLAYLNRGIALMKVGRFQRAIADFNEVLRRERDHSLARSLREQAMNVIKKQTS